MSIPFLLCRPGLMAQGAGEGVRQGDKCRLEIRHTGDSGGNRGGAQAPQSHPPEVWARSQARIS